MVVGNYVKRLEHIKFLVNQGRDESKGYYHPEIGFNYRMTNIEAAMGLAQISRLNEFLKKKRKFNAIYRDLLGGLSFIRFQEECKEAQSSYWFTSITIDKDIDIGDIQIKLRDESVPTRRVFMPITEFPPYKKYRRGDYENSYRIYETGLCLPSSTLNSESDIHLICKAVKRVLK
jgi:perosamine synthetase